MASVIKQLLKIFIYPVLFISTGFAFLSVSQAATFSMMPTGGSFVRQCTTRVDIEIDVTGETSNAAEVIINYNPTAITIIDSMPTVAGTQIQSGNAYESYFYNNVNTTTGEIRLAGASFIENLTSKQIFGSIFFQSIGNTPSATFTIKFDGVGNTLDSNIAHSTTNLDLLTGVQNGNYTFTVGTCDADTIPPNVQFISPQNGSINVPANASLTFRVTDVGSGVDLTTLEFILNGVTYRPGDPEVSYSGTDANYLFTLSPGGGIFPNQANSFIVKGADKAGNNFIGQIFFNIPTQVITLPIEDTQPPQVTPIVPTDLQINVPEDSIIEFLVTDNLSGVNLNTLVIILNGQEFTIDHPWVSYSGNELEYLIRLAQEGLIVPDEANVLRIIGTDNAGNAFERIIVFNIPSVPVVCPTIPDPTDPLAPPTQTCDLENVTVSEIPNIINQIIRSDRLLEGTIFENTIINEIIKDSGFAGFAALLAAILFALNAIPLLTLLLSAPGLGIKFFGILFGKRTQNPWGIVTDASTGKPIPFAVCELYVAGSQYKLNQAVTDLEGRYGFVIQAGEYRLEIKQSGYTPFEETITIKPGETSYVYDAKLVPTDKSAAVKKHWFKDATKRFVKIYSKATQIIFVFGFVFSFISLLISFTLLNVVIAIIYSALVLGYLSTRLLHRPKYASVVNSQNELRIPYAQVRIYDTATWKLVDSVTTNYNGYFDFYGDEGTYGLLVSIRGYKFPSTKNTLEVAKDKYSSMVLAKLKKGRNNIFLYVDPVEGEQQTGNIQSPFH